MKKLSVASALVLVCCLLWSGAALARTMTVVNNTGAELLGLNISKDNGDNVSNLLKKPLPKGKSVTVDLDSGNTGWNVIAIDGKNEAHVGEGLNFAGKSKIVVSGGAIKLR